VGFDEEDEFIDDVVGTSSNYNFKTLRVMKKGDLLQQLLTFGGNNGEEDSTSNCSRRYHKRAKLCQTGIPAESHYYNDFHLFHDEIQAVNSNYNPWDSSYERWNDLHKSLFLYRSYNNLLQQVIDPMLLNRPDYLSQTTRRGSLPLHVACYFSVECSVIRRLIMLYPQSIKIKNMRGDTPLMCSFLSLESVRTTVFDETLMELVCAYPQAVSIKNLEGASPLSECYSQCQSILSSNNRSGKRESLLLSKSWKKLVILLCASDLARGVDMVEAQNLLLHRLVKYECPMEILSYAIRQYPKLLLHRDELGRTPLMLACIAKREVLSSEYLEILLNACPSMGRITDCLGRLPLQVALEDGSMSFSNGIKTLIESSPICLRRQSNRSHLYPFMTAATRGDIDTTFNLLKCSPDLIQIFVGE